MHVPSDRTSMANKSLCRALIATILCVLSLGAQAQNKCSASGVMGGEKFAANNCAVAVFEESVAIWFNEASISAKEAEDFQLASYAGDKRDGKPRTLLQIMFCPGGGAATASAAAVKSIQVNTNHAKSPLLGIQTVVESPKDFKVEKMVGQIKPGGTLAGKIVGRSGETTFNLDFDVKLPAKEAAAGLACGK